MIPLFKVHMPKSAGMAVQKVLQSGYVGQGPKVKEFEKRLTEFLGTNNAITLNSGTSALQLAVSLVGIEPGDEVLSTPLTMVATNFSLLHAGADIKWCDVDPGTCNIDPDSVKEKITERTKAVMVVHWGGYPCDLDSVREAAGDIPVIEDCAHAFGAKYKNQMIGTSGNYCAFSFQAIKTLSTVDGGCLVVPDGFTHRAKLLRWYGFDKANRYNTDGDRCEIDIPEAGWKYHMNDVNAAIGIEQMSHVRDVIAKQRKNSAFFDWMLRDVPGVCLLERDPAYLSSCWSYTMKVKKRSDFIRMMKDRGIQVSGVHERNDHHSCLSRFQAELPQLDSFSHKIVCIPVHWGLSLKDREYIARSIKRGW